VQAGHKYDSTWHGQVSAWMTDELFTEWARSFNTHIAATKQKRVLLIIDNASVHNTLYTLKLSHVSVLFLPPITTGHLQPLDQGIIASLKRRYRTARDATIAVEKLNSNNIETHTNLHTARSLSDKKWAEMKSSVIINCWKHADILAPAALDILNAALEGDVTSAEALQDVGVQEAEDKLYHEAELAYEAAETALDKLVAATSLLCFQSSTSQPTTQ